MTVFALLLFLFQAEPGPPLFINRCAGCHGSDARGTAKAPGLAMNARVAAQSADQLAAYLTHGNPGAGMPSFAAMSAKDLMALAKYLRHVNRDMIVMPPPPKPARKMTWSEPTTGDWLTYN